MEIIENTMKYIVTYILKLSLSVFACIFKNNSGYYHTIYFIIFWKNKNTDKINFSNSAIMWEYAIRNIRV